MSRTLAAPFALALALLPVLGACGPDTDDDDSKDHDNHGEASSPHCEDTETPLAAGEAGPNGLSADELLAAIPAALLGSIDFEDGVESGLDIQITVDPDTVRHVASEAVYPTHGATNDIAIMCDDRVEVDAVVQIVSEDGRLAESVAVALYAPVYEDGAQPGTSETIILGAAELDPDALEGTLSMGDLHDLSGMDEVRMFLNLELVGAELFGALDGQGSGSDGNTAWAENLPVASFSAMADEVGTGGPDEG